MPRFWRFWARPGAAWPSRACGRILCRATGPYWISWRAAARASSGRTARRCLKKSALRGTEIDLADCPDLGPVLMVLGALCKGETVIRNAARLRMKESDRIAAMEQELRKMGAELFSTQDTVTVRGGALHGADGLYGHNDHRVVMALAVAAYAAGVPAAIGGRRR